MVEKTTAPLVTADVTKGVAERVLYGIAMAILMKAVQKGWITADEAPYYAGGFVTLIGGLYAWWINRPLAIAQSAAALPNTTVITTSDIAANTAESNILSTDVVRTAPK